MALAVFIYLFLTDRQEGGREVEESFRPLFFIFFLNGTQREQHAEAEEAGGGGKGEEGRGGGGASA